MTVTREPPAGEEKHLSQRAAYLEALLEAARKDCLASYPEYSWNEELPAEPRIVVAGVPVHVEGVDNAEYVIDGSRRISVTRIQLALRAIRDHG